MTDRFITAQHDKTTEPLPLEEEFQDTSQAQRIWIGNMDTKITEFTMIQILKKFGKIKQFDFLVHKTGALQGQPRGFCFVSFEKESDAARAILKLSNIQVLSKRLQVRWAHSNQSQNRPDPKSTLKLPSDTTDSGDSQSTKLQSNSSNAMIRAIEAKLNQMDKTKSSTSSSGAVSSSSQLHPLLAISKQNAAAAKEATHPYYRRKRRRRLHKVMGNISGGATKECIFCQICEKKHPDSKKILKENETLVIFSDINPASKHHYLIVPKKHLHSPKTLHTREDIATVNEMVEFGTEFLKEQGGNTEEMKIGFHWPPLISISHLHLHIIYPPSAMGLVHRAMYNNSYFVSPEYVIEKIETKL